MKEAAGSFVARGTEFLDVERVKALVLKDNETSIAVLKAVGFQMTGEEDVFIETAGRSVPCFRFDWYDR
jgi:RimJ/RimL family protein N-acetyltransferase